MTRSPEDLGPHDNEHDPTHPSPLMEAMLVHAEGMHEDRIVEAERARRIGFLDMERRRRESAISQRLAEQNKRNVLGQGTPPHEVLDPEGCELIKEFMHFIELAEDDDGTDRFDLATKLPVGQGDQRKTVRGFLIGVAGEEPGDSGWVKSAKGLYLCEDGTLRTYRRPDTPPAKDPDADPYDKLPPAEGVPLHRGSAEYEPIYPGHFTMATVGRRRVAKPGQPLPPGVESGSALYRDGGSKVQYQSHQVHLYRPQTLEASLAATAYHVIQQNEPRPMYDRFSPKIT